jgi:tRNA (mo5U34)-methyltransferase
MLNLYNSFWKKLEALEFSEHDMSSLQKLTSAKLKKPIQGDYPRWFKALSSLPDIEVNNVEYSSNAITCQADEIDGILIKQCYQGLMPWRKGPFELFDCFIDSEWQSWMKWNRIQEKLPPLENKLILDVGCGNGYYMFRMKAQNPLLLMGIDPGLLQVMQFWSIEKYAQSQAVVLPLAMEDLPTNLNYFDVVFSMGVLYHRKSPIHHILELAATIKQGGHLVLETLIVDGDEMTCLLPTGRYAQMRNVWFLPSIAMLSTMIERNGFSNVKCINVTETTIEEQRSTQWMKFHSLEQFLSDDLKKTKEGYKPPKRATLIAMKK